MEFNSHGQTVLKFVRDIIAAILSMNKCNHCAEFYASSLHDQRYRSVHTDYNTNRRKYFKPQTTKTFEDDLH
jgi:hypothetical protein